MFYPNKLFLAGPKTTGLNSERVSNDSINSNTMNKNSDGTTTTVSSITLDPTTKTIEDQNLFLTESASKPATSVDDHDDNPEDVFCGNQDDVDEDDEEEEYKVTATTKYLDTEEMNKLVRDSHGENLAVIDYHPYLDLKLSLIHI